MNGAGEDDDDNADDGDNVGDDEDDAGHDDDGAVDNYYDESLLMLVVPHLTLKMYFPPMPCTILGTGSKAKKSRLSVIITLIDGGCIRDKT